MNESFSMHHRFVPALGKRGDIILERSDEYENKK